MAKTLKEQYIQRKLEQKLAAIEETRAAGLLKEAIDEEEFVYISNMINYINKLSTQLDVDELKNASKNAIEALNKYTGGGTLEKAWQKLKTRFTGGENPLKKASAFATAITSGLRLLPQIIKNLGVNVQKDGEKALKDCIDDDKLEAATRLLKKAFTQKGRNSIPYLKDINTFVAQILDLSVNTLTKTANLTQQKVAAGPSKNDDKGPTSQEDPKKNDTQAADKDEDAKTKQVEARLTQDAEWISKHTKVEVAQAKEMIKALANNDEARAKFIEYLQKMG
jgi:hypothetical protein